MAREPYNTLSNYYKTLFGEKIYKIALNANLTCPNRDGKIDTRGCLFCSEGGSGEFAGTPTLSILEQIEQGKELLKNKTDGTKFVAYFQAFTNTYGDLDYLRKVYTQALHHPDIVGISIATRPDCLDEPILELLSELNKVKKIWIELGLQTIHEASATLIRRGYPLPVFDAAVDALHLRGLDIVVHLIIGIPYESKEQILETLAYVVSKPIQGVKLQLLHILKGTDLAQLYIDAPFSIPTLEQYTEIIVDCIEHIPPRMVVHRITGDGPKHLLLAPIWSGNKKQVLNTIHHSLKKKNAFQGKAL